MDSSTIFIIIMGVIVCLLAFAILFDRWCNNRRGEEAQLLNHNREVVIRLVNDTVT